MGDDVVELRLRRRWEDQNGTRVFGGLIAGGGAPVVSTRWVTARAARSE